MGVASTERALLSDLFDQMGPDEPTLCEGWKTRDLAVHLVTRERRPDALFGKLMSSLEGRGERVMAELRDKPWPELVELVRQGPPRWHPFSANGVDELVNSGEFFVHHEDVRRAQPDWEPRANDPDRDEALWRVVAKTGKLTYRRSPVGVTLRRPDGTEAAAKRGPRTVRILGEPGELLMHAFGRDQVRVEFEGDKADVLAVNDLPRRV